jgi:hypothetical protein
MKKSQLISVLYVLIFMATSVRLLAQVPGNGLVFDGNNDYVDVPSTTSDELNPAEFLTLECWVKLNEVPSVSHRPHLITKFASYALAVDTNGYASVFVYTGDWHFTQSTTPILTDVWYHMAGTYDGATVRIYINGVMENSAPVNLTLSQNIENVRIGALHDIPDNTNTSGIIEEARIWNTTRSQSEIQGSMNRTIPGSTSGLVGYWRFDESSGTNADCQTTFNNDGTLLNMSVPSAWTTSTASIGDNSIFAVSADLTETAGCAVDVEFRASPEGPGSGHSMAVMQVNQLPNNVSGLEPNKAQRYWEIWSEDPDFDGNFTADVRFHYDNISGFNNENSLRLFRRDDANDTWSAVTGYTVITDDGGSSTTGDGIGYVELSITENTPGDFSGQYILSWGNNDPPVVSNIPGQSVPEGTAFTAIALDGYVNDPDNADNEITWTVTGENNVTVSIVNRVATITPDDPDWNGTDMVTFTAEDPEGESDSDQVTFEVTPVNDPPVVGDIPNQEVAEGSAFATITLDNFVTDIDNDITTITWEATGQSNLTVDITDRVATITVNDPEWNGSETITFQAEDPDGDIDADQATLTVTPVNDPPVVDDIPDQDVDEGTAFATITLDDFVADADDADNTITWTSTGQTNLNVVITNRVATITVNDPEWNGSESIVFLAEDPLGGQDSDTAVFTVTPVNDSPVVSDIPDLGISEGQGLAQGIDLDGFVADVDDPDSVITWTVAGESNVTVDVIKRIAYITADDPDWNGSDTLIFTATDPLGASDTDTCIFTVMPVNDPPTLNRAIPDTTADANHAFSYVLDPNTFGDIDAGDKLVYSAVISMGGVTPAWITFDPVTKTFSGTPADEDKGMVEAIVTATDDSLASVADTFNIEVKSYVGIGNPLTSLIISLYPNPNNGRFVIESDIFELKDVVLEIFNEKGQLIWNREIKDEIGTLHESVDLNSAPDGLYLLRVRNKSGMINKRFVISY